MRYAFLIAVGCLFAFCSSSSKSVGEGNQPVTIQFKNTVNGEPFELGKSFSNPFGEEYTVNILKYYISNISFEYKDGNREKIADSYYLVNEQDSSSLSFDLTASPKNIRSISFMIGVDSIRNFSGVQTGALDPANGMFWTWNSGYIMAKLEGTSQASTGFNKKLELHIGGFRYPNNTAMEITLPVNERDINKEGKLVISTDINHFFNGVHALRISEHAICTTPGALARQYSENYATMFSIKSRNK